VTAISGYAEPKVWIGADYVVVSRRQLSGSSHVATGRNVKIQVFSWDGEWLEWDLNENLPSITVSQKNSSGDWVSGNFSDNTKYKHQDFHVTLQRDFFAVLYKTTSTNVYALRIYRRNENQRGGWTKFENT